MKRLGSAVFLFVFLLLPSLAFAQTQRNPCYYTSANPGPGNGCIPVSSVNPLPVAATATIGGGFTDAATGTPISATTLGVTGTLPAGAVVTAFNVGTTNTAYCKLGASATVNDIAIPPASWFAFQSGANTQLTCITSTSTTTVNMVGGSGLPTGSGGGGGGSGGGGTASSFDAAFPATGTAIGLSDGTNMKAWLTALIQAKSGVNGNNMGSVAPWLWNGTSFDAATGTAALGQYVQAKSGAYAAGAGVDGWDVTNGAKADSVCATSGGTCSLVALVKFLNAQAVTIATNSGSSIPACGSTPCTTTIGNVGSDPSSGKATPSSAAINVSTATTTQLVAISGTTKIYVTSFDVIAGGTGNITFEYGTGASCGTGTTILTGAYNLTAQAGIAKGNGLGAVLVVPAGNALCVLTTAAVQMSGSVSYQQF